MRKLLHKIVIIFSCVAISCAISTHQAYADARELFHASIEDENYWIEFVTTNREIDLSSYLASNKYDETRQPIVWYAALRNYVRLLKALESRGAISRYVVRDGPSYYDLTPLDAAMMTVATQSIEYLARLRPDWLHRDVPTSVGQPVIEAFVDRNYPMVDILINLGADINARDRLGFTLMDRAAGIDIEIYEIVRRRGGRFQKDRFSFGIWGNGVREALIEKYLAHSCALFTNRIELPTGVSVEYPSIRDIPYSDPHLYRLMPPRRALDPISRESRSRIADELRVLGELCSGTIVFQCHDGWMTPKKNFIDPILDELNLVGIFIAAPGADKDIPDDRVDFYPSFRATNPAFP